MSPVPVEPSVAAPCGPTEAGQINLQLTVLKALSRYSPKVKELWPVPVEPVKVVNNC